MVEQVPSPRLDIRALELRDLSPNTHPPHISHTSLLFGFLIYIMGMTDYPGPSYLPPQGFNMAQWGKGHSSPAVASPSLPSGQLPRRFLGLGEDGAAPRSL